MNEASKSHHARLRNGDYESILHGEVLDVGCGPDPIKLDSPSTVRPWDLEDGDAEWLHGVKDESFDAVFSSHCLEHMVSVPNALTNWARVTKEGGHVYVVVPSWLAYERHQWPSPYNPDHKASFDIVDLGMRPIGHPFYGFKEMRQIGLQCGLTLIDTRMELDNYDFTQLPNKGNDQTLGNALAQCVFIYLKA